MDIKGEGLARDNVYHKLRKDILSCELRPGQTIQEKDLVDVFGVSRSPIRDALLKLAEQGLIEVMPRKGYRVRRIELTDVRDMYGVRQMFEREAIGLLVENASDAILKELDRFREHPGGDLTDWIEYNRGFHGHIAHHCGNARLARIALGMIEEIDRLTLVSVSSQSREALDGFVAEHRAIIDAIQERNKRQAVALARAHIEGSRRRVMASLESSSIVDTQPQGNRAE